MNPATIDPEIIAQFRGNNRAVEILIGLRCIVLAQQSIRRVQSDPAILRTVKAVCAANGVEW